MTLYVMCGLPGSGKSTCAQAIRGNPAIVSSDAVRADLYGSEEIQGNPKEVFAEVHARVGKALQAGKDVVYDATNLTVRTRKSILKKFPHAKHVCIFIDTPLKVCLAQNALRDRKVPTGVIERMSRALERPCLEEGFDEIIKT